MTDISIFDRRILRTKAAIRAALIELIEEKGFDALLVSDIAARANINRGTFYLHYTDKFDLLDKIESEIVQDLERIFFQTNYIDLAEFNTIEKSLPQVEAIFAYIRDNLPLMHALLGVKGGAGLQDKIRRLVEKDVRLGVVVGIQAKNFWVPGEYLISYVISAHFGVIQTWLQRGCVETPHEMAKTLSKLSWYGTVRNTGIVTAD